MEMDGLLIGGMAGLVTIWYLGYFMFGYTNK